MNAPGQAELRDLIRKRWSEVLPPAESPDEDQVLASLAAETALAALTPGEPPVPGTVPDLLLDKMDQLDRIGDMCRRPADVAGRSSGSGVVNGTNLAAAILRVVMETPQERPAAELAQRLGEAEGQIERAEALVDNYRDEHRRLTADNERLAAALAAADAAQERPAPDPDGQQRYIDRLHDLVRDILSGYIIEPSAGSAEYWRRAGQLHVCDTDGHPFGAGL